MNQYRQRPELISPPRPNNQRAAPPVTSSLSYDSDDIQQLAPSILPFNLKQIIDSPIQLLSTPSADDFSITGHLNLSDPALLRVPNTNKVLLGIAPVTFDDGHALLGVAFITSNYNCLYIDCASWRANHQVASASIEALAKHLFENDRSVLLVAFDFAQAAIAIKRDFDRDAHGVDLSSLGLEPGIDAPPPAIVVQSLFGKGKFPGLSRLWQDNWVTGEGGAQHGGPFAAVRAALALKVAARKLDEIRRAKELDTRRIWQEQVEFFSAAYQVTTRLQALKPKFAKAEFSLATPSNREGEVSILNSKFATKIRKDVDQTMKITTADGQTIQGVQVKKARGKSTTLLVKADKRIEVKEVEVVGRASGTLADSQWQAYMRGSLDGTISVYQSDHNTRILWNNSRRQRNRRLAPVAPLADGEAVLPLSPSADRLNPSQRKAHDAITAPWNPKVDKGSTMLITGPPGTGKTSVISASVQTFLLRNPSPSPLAIYCVTASNVAAKNIAESLLLSAAQFGEFRLIVSKDFFEEWHEHQYDSRLGQRVVDSGRLGPGIEKGELEEVMGGVRVIIATLSMLSSRNLKLNSFFATYPMSTLLVDEASQIRLDEYPHVFNRFHSTLRRVAFFGDERQLAPYNSAQIPLMKSVFQLKHLEQDAFFLDTQYRMPSLVGDFISKHVYNKKLLSAVSVSKDTNCVRFVDVCSGCEEKEGHSTLNRAEVEVVVELVRSHYGDTNFSVLTPYDAQREEIERSLKQNGLPWEDRVFNVDSFQGQEDDIIIVSIVKTSKLGFLNELRRSNVMLTRLKRAMVVVTNRGFLTSVARQTLVGQMAAELTKGNPNSDWITELSILRGTIKLPESGSGVRGVVPKPFPTLSWGSPTRSTDNGWISPNSSPKKQADGQKPLAANNNAGWGGEPEWTFDGNKAGWGDEEEDVLDGDVDWNVQFDALTAGSGKEVRGVQGEDVFGVRKLVRQEEETLPGGWKVTEKVSKKKGNETDRSQRWAAVNEQEPGGWGTASGTGANGLLLDGGDDSGMGLDAEKGTVAGTGWGQDDPPATPSASISWGEHTPVEHAKAATSWADMTEEDMPANPGSLNNGGWGAHDDTISNGNGWEDWKDSTPHLRRGRGGGRGSQARGGASSKGGGGRGRGQGNANGRGRGRGRGK
ncbi:P-loop containing nucleoside triphosphate hydrolase protein [Meredithblackwellia eburnea MCA 4105]